MKDIEHFLRMQREFERLRDPYGLGQVRQLMSLKEQLTGSLYKESLIESLGRSISSTNSLTEFARGSRGIAAVAESMSRLGSTLEVTKALEQASRISRFSREFESTAAGRSMLELTKQPLIGASREMMCLVETVKTLSEQLARSLPGTVDHWARAWARDMRPWFAAHEESWPQDRLLLRMIDGPTKMGVASWLLDTSAEPDEADAFLGLAAVTTEQTGPDSSTPLHIELEVRCALCEGVILSPSSEASWIGPHRLRQRIDVIPLCRECSARDLDEPGYIRRGLIELYEEPQRDRQPVLEIMDGEETDPVPRGRLQLVPAPEPDDEEE